MPRTVVIPEVNQEFIARNGARLCEARTFDFTEIFNGTELNDDFKHEYNIEGGFAGCLIEVGGGRTGIVIGWCPPSTHGISGEDRSFVAVLFDRPGRGRYEYTGEADLSSFRWPDGFDDEGTLYVSFHRCISELNFKYTGERGVGGIYYQSYVDPWKNPDFNQPPPGGFPDWSAVADSFEVGPIMNNPFNFTAQTKRPLHQDCHSKSYLMGIRLPSGHLIPVGALKQMTLAKISSLGRIQKGRGSDTMVKLHRVIICHTLGSTLTAPQKFNRDVVRPLEEYLRNNPNDISQVDGVISVTGNPALQQYLRTLQFQARGGMILKWKRDMLNSSEVGHCWFKKKLYILSDDQLESIDIEHIRTSEGKVHPLYTKGGTCGAVNLRGNVFDIKTRLEGIGEDGSDEAWIPTGCLSHRQVGVIARNLGLVPPNDVRFLDIGKANEDFRSEFSKEILVNKIVNAKDAYNRGEPYRTYAQPSDSDSGDLAFIASRISGLLEQVDSINSGNDTESAAGAPTNADASAADARAVNTDKALRECNRLLDRANAILTRSHQALKISSFLFEKTGHSNCVPHSFSSKSKKIQQASRQIALIVRAVESCNGAMDQLAGLKSSFTDEQRRLYLSIRESVDKIVAQLNGCGIELNREKLNSWDKRAEGKWNELFARDELLEQMLQANTMMFKEKRVRPDWMIMRNSSGKIYILILELDEHRHDAYLAFIIHQRLTFLECACKDRYGDKFGGIDFVFFNTAETIEPNVAQAKMISRFVKDRITLTNMGQRDDGSNLFVFDYACKEAMTYVPSQSDVSDEKWEYGTYGPKVNHFGLNDHHMVDELKSRQLRPDEDAPEDLDWKKDSDCMKRFLRVVKFFETPEFYPGELPDGE